MKAQFQHKEMLVEELLVLHYLQFGSQFEVLAKGPSLSNLGIDLLKTLFTHHDKVECGLPKDLLKDFSCDSQPIETSHIAVGDDVLVLLTLATPFLSNVFESRLQILSFVIKLFLLNWNIRRVENNQIRFFPFYPLQEGKAIEE